MLCGFCFFGQISLGLAYRSARFARVDVYVVVCVVCIKKSRHRYVAKCFMFCHRLKSAFYAHHVVMLFLFLLCRPII